MPSRGLWEISAPMTNITVFLSSIIAKLSLILFTVSRRLDYWNDNIVPPRFSNPRRLFVSCEQPRHLSHAGVFSDERSNQPHSGMNNISKIAIKSRSIIFLVTSCINVSATPLFRNTARSIFSSSERFTQTCETLESIRKKVPDALVILLENSVLNDEQTLVFKSIADWLVLFGDDNESVLLSHGPYKGAAEVYMLGSLMPMLEPFDYEVLFKLSGRFKLTDRFDHQRFPRDRFGFLKRDGSFSTRLYSVPKNLEKIYEAQIAACELMARNGASIEHVITRGVPRDMLHLMSHLGVSGNIAPNNFWIDE